MECYESGSAMTIISDSLKDEYKNISDYHNAISSELLDKWGELHEEKVPKANTTLTGTRSFAINNKIVFCH